jgi:hypothetical protein
VEATIAALFWCNANEEAYTVLRGALTITRELGHQAELGAIYSFSLHYARNGAGGSRLSPPHYQRARSGSPDPLSFGAPGKSGR